MWWWRSLGLVAVVAGACGGAQRGEARTRVTRSFTAHDVEVVELRAGSASEATVTRGSAGVVRVSGTAEGGVEGYHSADEDWNETAASKVGMQFREARFGSILVISTVNERSYIHHHYELDDLVLEVPPDVEVRLVDRRLDGDGAPDLAPPPGARDP